MSTSLRLTPHQYDQMIAKGAFVGFEKRIELIHGELREMNPAGPAHCDYINFLARWSFESTRDTSIVVSIQNIIDADDSRPEPDITWLKPGRYAHRHPTGNDVLLVIEVADSSLRFDRGEKLAIYASQNIPEYWIVDIADRCIEVFTGPELDDYSNRRRVEVDGAVRPTCCPAAELKLADLFIL
ncbi:hypothetical protein Poly51_17860 [Rubripirellula tenax]|uniref:Putative restriction endonuclease domain-containing protein n=1 Tax=Rubripirellula tenax TaxID=2528015 RepID=A0A5C6FHD2_9BACT|nr:Uma2 family endonuclease [Rubripirellula tenax]TWU59001.1 hypothetical protein Poly51_17860 [Rubripirellula tenax]